MSSSGRGKGRGWYYKQKYGGGRDGGRGGSSFQQQQRGPPGLSDPMIEETDFQDFPAPSLSSQSHNTRGSSADLERTLRRIDGCGYKAYHDIHASWRFDSFTLHMDRIQGDPYASPSKCRISIPAAVAGFPPELYNSPIRRTALCDYLTRTFGAVVKASGGDVRAASGGWHGEKGGDMAVDSPGQHVLQRSSVLILPNGDIEARFTVGLPARGRSVLGNWAALVLVNNLPKYVCSGLQYHRLDTAAVKRHVECVEDSERLRNMLPELGLVAFVGDGSILPRSSGANDQPMAPHDAVPFTSPDSLAVEVTLPNRGLIRGMGIKKGITLIIGGGFHGKSTLLEALQYGIYNKIPGDGRELVVTDPNAVKIRAEDGRRVASVDISPFISNLPLQRDTRCFSSLDASGSTSQAANIVEALELGASTLLIDEDTTASNFMLRDQRMRELISKDREPITPFVERIRSLAADPMHVSCILVIGGTGEYFSKADCVVAMDNYKAEDVTTKAHAIVEKYERLAMSAGLEGGDFNGKKIEQERYPEPVPRTIHSLTSSPGQRGGGSRTESGGSGGSEGASDKMGGKAMNRSEIKCKTHGMHEISFGGESLDLGAVEQLVEASQTRAIAEALIKLNKQWTAAGGHCRGKSLREMLTKLDKEMDDTEGLDVLLGGGVKMGNLARPRKFEIAAAVNRLRCAQMHQLL